MIVAIAIQHDFAYGSYCVSAVGSDTWPRLVHERKNTTVWFAINCFIHINYRLFMTYVVKAPACLSKLLSQHATKEFHAGHFLCIGARLVQD